MRENSLCGHNRNYTTLNHNIGGSNARTVIAKARHVGKCGSAGDREGTESGSTGTRRAAPSRGRC